MHLDTSQFPLVFIEQDGVADPSPEEELEALLAREQRFVVIAPAPSSDAVRNESPESRKHSALVFKRLKPQLRRFCAGMIVIEGDNPMSKPLKFAAHAVCKAFGLTLMFVKDRSDAIAEGDRLANA